MGDLLQTGADWLEGRRHEHLTHPVTYCRPSAGSGQGAESVELKATVGQTTFEVQRDFGAEKVESRDFLIRAADLVLGGQPTEPQRGDRIKETLAGQVVVFEVMAPGDEPPWRYSDPGRKTLRVHTKQIGAE